MRNYCKGMATPTAVIFTMVSMLITAGYLKYAMSASVSQKYRFEEAKALLMAETGIITRMIAYCWMFTIMVMQFCAR